MKARCPAFECCSKGKKRQGKQRFSPHGTFYRTSESKTIHRWICRDCGKTFSQATLDPCFGQKKRRANLQIGRLLCSGVSQRRIAILLSLHRTTVIRKFHFIAEQARLDQPKYIERFRKDPLGEVIFDEMETFEHSKLKPVSLVIVISAKREILHVELARMPAKGLLARLSRKKYGKRKDERPQALRKTFKEILPLIRQDALFKSDKNPRYPSALKQRFPKAKHVTTKGGRACVVGQGELKRLVWDPIFALNHTAAMFRANMNRLFRKTWCTTKTLRGLSDHLAIYARYHNRILLVREGRIAPKLSR